MQNTHDLLVGTLSIGIASYIIIYYKQAISLESKISSCLITGSSYQSKNSLCDLFYASGRW